ncbi:MAG: galactose-1-phosphate uridylyltransferase [Bryobacteraceae bacterium]|nr:galactose-1-phosphate uridylyltransferase [Bryobacteraceae bacterium]
MPELRKDPITGRWVIIAAERAMRPSDFIRQPAVPTGGRFCPFCPGNESKTPPEVLAYRPGGGRPNEPGWTLRVVPNKFPALRVEGDLNRQGEGVYDRMNGVGAHEVVIETPDHMLTLSELSEKQVEDVFWAMRDRIVDLRRDKRLRYIIVFKNHGAAAGATLEHTHSQLIALPVVPKRAQEELDGSRRYFDYRERCIFCDILRQESDSGARVVLESEHFLAITPYASRFPFETWILPKRHSSHFEASEIPEMQNLGWIERAILRKIDKVLERPAYNLMIHSSPVQEGAMAHYHWHIEIIPKLTNAAGFEWGTGFYINPTPPEEAARFLRDVGLV